MKTKLTTTSVPKLTAKGYVMAGKLQSGDVIDSCMTGYGLTKKGLLHYRGEEVATDLTVRFVKTSKDKSGEEVTTIIFADGSALTPRALMFNYYRLRK